MKVHMSLNDGTFLYNKDSVVNYLSSLGFDIEDLAECLLTDSRSWKDGTVVLHDDAPRGDDWEAIADGYLQSYENIRDEVEAHSKQFLAGRKETKAMFVDWLNNFLEDGLYNY